MLPIILGSSKKSMIRRKASAVGKIISVTVAQVPSERKISETLCDQILEESQNFGFQSTLDWQDSLGGKKNSL